MENLKRYAKSIRRRKYNGIKQFKAIMSDRCNELSNNLDEHIDIQKWELWRKTAFYICIYIAEVIYPAIYNAIDILVDVILGKATLFQREVDRSLVFNEDLVRIFKKLEGTNITIEKLDYMLKNKYNRQEGAYGDKEVK